MSKRNLIHAVALSDSSVTPSGAIWAILVQPKKIARWFRDEVPAAVVHGSHGKINDVRSDSFLVKILLGENVIHSVDSKVEATLRTISAPDSQSWLHDAVLALQQAEIVTQFDLDEFTVISTKALAVRTTDSSATSVVELDHEGRPMRQASEGLEEKVAALKKSERKKSGFWLSYGPNVTLAQPKRHVQRDSWERQDEAYGGLM